MAILWPDSYPDLIQRAEHHRATGQYGYAFVEYLNAAKVAPSEDDRTELLGHAYWCQERLQGRYIDDVDDEP